MRILFLARSTLYTVYGGDTVQMVSTAKYLEQLGVQVDIRLAHEKIDYQRYDLIHIFNIIRPADLLTHIQRSNKPYVVSTIFVDFTEYQKKVATGMKGFLARFLTLDQLEYAKAIGRWMRNGESIKSKQYLWLGHRKAVQYLASNAAFLLPNSESEYRRFVKHYNTERPYRVVYNGIDPDTFRNARYMNGHAHDPKEILCVARIEGNKNQLNLIRALNNTSFRLRIVGKPAPNHQSYYEGCRREAAANISFENFIPHEELADYYTRSKVHVLPSWNETCGLSSMEAAFAGCNIVITDKGDTVEYFGNNAFYCNPEDPASIYAAVENASNKPVSDHIRNKIISRYNWREAAAQTLSVYEQVLNVRKPVAKAIITEETCTP